MPKVYVGGKRVYQRKDGTHKGQELSLEQFLGLRGLSSPISDYTLDKTRLPHGETERQKKRRISAGLEVAKDYANRRAAAISEYERLVADGRIVKPTALQKRLLTAQGHPDNPSVQAARRILTKRGIDWKTGSKL